MFVEFPGCRPFANIRAEVGVLPAICALLFDKLASASRPKGFKALSGKECNFGDPGRKWLAEGPDCGGGEGELRRACVCAVAD